MQTINDFLINYSAAPTGKAWVGAVKRPLVPNTTGFGYLGVLVQSENKELIQCAVCGEWLRKINAWHLKSCSGGEIVSCLEYKKRFGLLKTTGLVSDITSLRLTKNALKAKRHRLPPHSQTKKREGVIGIAEHDNKYGICDRQIKTRLKEFILSNRELPNCGNRGRALYRAIYRRWGGIRGCFLYYGLPDIVRVGTKYKVCFPGHTMYYNINHIGDRESLFERLSQLDFFKT